MTGKNEQRANERQRGDGALPSFPSRFLPRDLLLADTSVHELEVLSAAPHHCDARLLGALHEVPNDAVTVLSSDFLHLAPQGFRVEEQRAKGNEEAKAAFSRASVFF